MLPSSPHRPSSVKSIKHPVKAGFLQDYATVAIYSEWQNQQPFRAQELCESRGGRPGLSVLTSLMVSVDVKLY